MVGWLGGCTFGFVGRLEEGFRAFMRGSAGGGRRSDVCALPWFSNWRFAPRALAWVVAQRCGAASWLDWRVVVWVCVCVLCEWDLVCWLVAWSGRLSVGSGLLELGLVGKWRPGLAPLVLLVGSLLGWLGVGAVVASLVEVGWWLVWV